MSRGHKREFIRETSDGSAWQRRQTNRRERKQALSLRMGGRGLLFENEVKRTRVTLSYLCDHWGGGEIPRICLTLCSYESG